MKRIETTKLDIYNFIDQCGHLDLRKSFKAVEDDLFNSIKFKIKPKISVIEFNENDIESISSTMVDIVRKHEMSNDVFIECYSKKLAGTWYRGYLIKVLENGGFDVFVFMDQPDGLISLEFLTFHSYGDVNTGEGFVQFFDMIILPENNSSSDEANIIKSPWLSDQQQAANELQNMFLILKLFSTKYNKKFK